MGSNFLVVVAGKGGVYSRGNYLRDEELFEIIRYFLNSLKSATHQFDKLKTALQQDYEFEERFLKTFSLFRVFF